MVAQSFATARRPPVGPARGYVVLSAVALLCAALSGCASLSNPVADAVPVRKLSPEVIGRRREEEHTISLSLLRQRPPDAYRLAPGDLLGVWVEGVLGEKGQPPPLRLPEQGNLPPAFGYPIAVRADGTISLPLIEPIKVAGMTVEEVQELIVKTYITEKIL